MANFVVVNGVKVASGTYAAFKVLAEAFRNKFGLSLLITSGYRSPEDQRDLYNSWLNGTFSAPSVAPPGTSLHEFGRALDVRDSGDDAGVTIAGNARSNWLRANASRYGFSPAGYDFGEPWHIEYQGDPWNGSGGTAGLEYNPNGYNKAYVKNVQNKLNVKGYGLDADGILGIKTFDAVKKYQSSVGLNSDGIPGPDTMAKLNAGAGVPTGSQAKGSSTGIIKAIQGAVRASQDGISGPDTKKRVHAVRTASSYGGVTFPYGVAYTQSVVGTSTDGIWGDNSMGAHDQAVIKIQKAVGVQADGVWGPDTDRNVRKYID